MLQRSYRLPSHTRFKQFQLYRTPFFTAKVTKNNLSYSRFGFIISKKIAKLAVDRNRSRRKLRTGIELMQDVILPGYDFLFLLTKILEGESTDTLQRCIKSLLTEKLLIKT